ncbi:MAG: hemolysin family protein [Myxococcales bacterium]|nr:hemolysin family protein [Myxococcales bacterium]
MAFEILIILALVLANGVLAGAEIAVISMRPGRLRELQGEGSKGALAVQRLREQPERFFATVQVGITVVGATAGAFGGASFARDLSKVLAQWALIEPWADEIALVLVVSLISYLSLVLGELVPKSLALRSAERYSSLVARPLLLLASLMRPLIWFLTASSNLVLRPFKDRTSFTEARLSADELVELMTEATRTGSVHPQAGEIAARALTLPELVASDVMVPRTSVISLQRDASRETLRRMMLEHTHSRFPVIEGERDRVVGYVNVKDVLAIAWEEQLFVLADLIRPAFFVPESKSAVELISEMRSRRVPFCVVVDEHGGMAGIVSLTDVLEELVGEIFGEHAAAEPKAFRRESDGHVVVRATMPIRELNRDLGIALPEGDWVTVGGLCLSLATRIPVPGERFTTDAGIVLEILDASPRRVRTVRIVMPAPETPKGPPPA